MLWFEPEPVREYDLEYLQLRAAEDGEPLGLLRGPWRHLDRSPMVSVVLEETPRRVRVTFDSWERSLYRRLYFALEYYWYRRPNDTRRYLFPVAIVPADVTLEMLRRVAGFR